MRRRVVGGRLLLLLLRPHLAEELFQVEVFVHDHVRSLVLAQGVLCLIVHIAVEASYRFRDAGRVWCGARNICTRPPLSSAE
jgi:hypothetical protein